MRLKQYLVEDREKDREKAKKHLALQIKVDPEHLDFIGDDKYGYYFNIKDKKHKDFGSTKLVKK